MLLFFLLGPPTSFLPTPVCSFPYSFIDITIFKGTQEQAGLQILGLVLAVDPPAV